MESALALPRMTFGGAELYPLVVDKAAVLGFALICNHPVIDGNKCIGHAAMEVFLVLNGYQIEASVDEQEQAVFQLASGALERDALTRRLVQHVRPGSDQSSET